MHLRATHNWSDKSAVKRRRFVDCVTYWAAACRVSVRRWKKLRESTSNKHRVVLPRSQLDETKSDQMNAGRRMFTGVYSFSVDAWLCVSLISHRSVGRLFVVLFYNLSQLNRDCVLMPLIQMSRFGYSAIRRANLNISMSSMSVRAFRYFLIPLLVFDLWS
jgi:hypothetical protein